MKSQLPVYRLLYFSWSLCLASCALLVIFKPFWALYFPHFIPEYISPNASPFEPPSLTHWFGTDESGRDLLIRLIFGAGHSCLFAFLVSAGTIGLGFFVALCFLFLPDKIREASSGLQECIGALPFLPLALILLSFFPGNILVLGILKIILGWPVASNLLLQEGFLVHQSPIIHAARTQGLKIHQIAIRFFFPLLLPIIISLFELFFISSILNLSALDFFGLGFPIPTPSIPEGFRQFIDYTDAWWLFLFPLLTLLFVLGWIRRIAWVDLAR